MGIFYLHGMSLLQFRSHLGKVIKKFPRDFYEYAIRSFPREVEGIMTNEPYIEIDFPSDLETAKKDLSGIIRGDNE